MNLREWWKAAKASGRIYYVTDHLSRTGMGGAYTLYTIREGELLKAWPSSEETHGFDAKLAKSLGFRMGKNWRAWYRGGCGYDRVFDIVESISRHCDGEKHPQVPISMRIEGLGDSG